MKKLFFFFISLLFLSVMSATGAVANGTPLSLVDYLAQVEASNPSLSAAQQRFEALQNRVSPAGALDDPFIALGVDEIPFGEQGVQAYRYQISQSLPFPGKLGAREKLASFKAESAEHETSTLRRELKVIGTQIFYRTYLNTQAIQLNMQLQTAVHSAMQSAKARYEAGGSEHHDWLLAKIELATLKVEQQKILREQFWLRTALNELRGQAPEAELELGTFSFPFTDLVPLEDELADQPELAALDALIRQSEYEHKLAKLSYYPDFLVQMMAMQPRDMGEMDTEQSNWGLMVGMNVPLYFGRKQSRLVAAAQHEQQAVAMDKVYLHNKLVSESENAKQALASAHDLVTLYETDVLPNTDLALANARSSYQAQRMNLAPYLALLKVQAIQQLEWVAAQIDVELAKTRLQDILASPPLLKLAPSRPTVFGTGNMGDAMPISGSVNMGGSMSAPKNAGKKSPSTVQGGSSGMGAM